MITANSGQPPLCLSSPFSSVIFWMFLFYFSSVCDWTLLHHHTAWPAMRHTSNHRLIYEIQIALGSPHSLCRPAALHPPQHALTRMSSSWLSFPILYSRWWQAPPNFQTRLFFTSRSWISHACYSLLSQWILLAIPLPCIALNNPHML